MAATPPAVSVAIKAAEPTGPASRTIVRILKFSLVMNFE
jgi:hypothetical protein